MKTRTIDLPVRLKRYKEKPKLVCFGGGGCTFHFSASHYMTGGYENPENFFRPSHWWAHQHREVHDLRAFEGVPYVDMREAVETTKGRRASIEGPMVNVDLPHGAISRLGSVPKTMTGIAGVSGDFAALLSIHQEQSNEAPRALDEVSIDFYLAHWKRAGATVGVIRRGKFCPL